MPWVTRRSWENGRTSEAGLDGGMAAGATAAGATAAGEMAGITAAGTIGTTAGATAAAGTTGTISGITGKFRGSAGARHGHILRCGAADPHCGAAADALL